MKKEIFIALAVTLICFLLTACQTEAEKTYATIPPGTYSVGTYNFTAADDLFATPGGITYAANVVEGDNPNPWPPVATVFATFGEGLDAITVQYRAYIESQAGQTRNNIFWVTRGHRFENNELVLYSDSVPHGIELTYSAGSGMPGSLMAILVITVSPQVDLGDYMFRIIIEIDGREYGAVSCHVRVIP